jgi:hypothetical protein
VGLDKNLIEGCFDRAKLEKKGRCVDLETQEIHNAPSRGA